MLNLFPVPCVSHPRYGSSITVLVPLGTPGHSCSTQEQEAVLKARTMLLRTIIPHLSIRTEVASSEQRPLEKKSGENKVVLSCLLPVAAQHVSGTPEPMFTLVRW